MVISFRSVGVACPWSRALPAAVFGVDEPARTAVGYDAFGAINEYAALIFSNRGINFLNTWSFKDL